MINLSKEQSIFLLEMEKQIAYVGNIANGNPFIEKIYAGFVFALKKAKEALEVYKQRLHAFSEAKTLEDVHPQDSSLILSLPQQYQASAITLVSCLLTLNLPSDVFRKEVLRQQKHILEELIDILRQEKETPEETFQAIQTICGILTLPCGEIAEDNQKTDSLLPLAAVAGVAYLAGKQANVSQ